MKESPNDGKLKLKKASPKFVQKTKKKKQKKRERKKEEERWDVSNPTWNILRPI
jgi:hypothetical protein